jgi:hypothetical protein
MSERLTPSVRATRLKDRFQAGLRKLANKISELRAVEVGKAKKSVGGSRFLRFFGYFPGGYLAQGNHNLTIVRLYQRFGTLEELPGSLGCKHHKFETTPDASQTILNRYT